MVATGVFIDRGGTTELRRNHDKCPVEKSSSVEVAKRGADLRHRAVLGGDEPLGHDLGERVGSTAPAAEARLAPGVDLGHRRADGLNHYTVMNSTAGASMVADAIRSAVAISVD